MIISMTGHRPDKLGGYYTPNVVQLAVVDGLKKVFSDLKPSCVITGMALGVDQWAAEICAANGIPFIAAIPFHGQEGKWPEHAQKRYHALLAKAHKAWIISPGPYDPVKMHIRNHWMVDACNLLVAVYDGSPGGTGKCVAYAEKVGRNIHFLKLAPEIWDLAYEMNPKSDKSMYYNPPSAEAEEKAVKATVSPFIALVKEKAEKKSKELAHEAQMAENAKFAHALKLLAANQEKDYGQKLIQQKLADEQFAQKLLDTYNKGIKKAQEKEESAKTVVHSFGRVLDLE